MKNILLVIDIQNGFMVSDSARNAQKRIDEIIGKNIFDEVIVTEYSNFEGSPIIRFMGWEDCLSKEDIEFTGEVLKNCPNVVRKTKYSAYGEDLLSLLKKCNDGELPAHVFIAGVDTGCCVLATATDLFEGGIQPIVLTYYCGSSGGNSYQYAATLVMHNLIGRNNIYDGIIGEKEDLVPIVEKAHNLSLNKEDTTESRARKLVDIMKQRKQTISFAESCTGGLAASTLVNIADASTIFNFSCVTYANEAKIKYAGVSPDTLSAFGAVSEQVAGEMAEGVAKNNGADVGVGISGIAGPSGGTAEKPVGHVCFGFYVDGKLTTATMDFGAIGRMEVRQKSVDFVFATLLKLLES